MANVFTFSFNVTITIVLSVVKLAEVKPEQIKKRQNQKLTL